MAMLLTCALMHSSPQIKVAVVNKVPSNESALKMCISCRPQRSQVHCRAAPSVKQQQSESESVAAQTALSQGIEFTGLHHVGLLCENLERSIEFYQGVLGLELNPDRPDDKLPYRGVWFWVGGEMIHLMELPNPDPLTGRPAHGGRDRHACVAIKDVKPLKLALENAGKVDSVVKSFLADSWKLRINTLHGLPFTLSQSGRPAIFTRDPDGNALEFSQFG